MLQPQVPIQTPEKRAHNFDEVVGGFTKKLATEEAIRCPQCTEAVCREACPLGIDIPSFIRSIREGNPQEALAKIRESNPLTGICGRICSAPCEAVCVFSQENASIRIRALERYAWDYGQTRNALRKPKEKPKSKIAVVGTGPSGLMAGTQLSGEDCEITFFESLHLPGGVLRYGIPSFRLPKKILDSEVKYIKSLGVSFEHSILVGRSCTLEELFDMGYRAIILALGAGVPQFYHIIGEHLGGVYFAEEFLIRVNLMQGHQYPEYCISPNITGRVAVIGRGHAALDCARIGVRLGREVTLIYQGTEDEIEVEPELIKHAKQEGVKFQMMTKVLEFLTKNKNCIWGIKCILLDFADPSRTGKWKLIPVEGSEFNIEVDSVIISEGNSPNVSIAKTSKDLRVNKNATIWVHKNSHMTSIPGVFIVGDLETGPSSVVHAMRQGKDVAQEVQRYLREHIFEET